MLMPRQVVDAAPGQAVSAGSFKPGQLVEFRPSAEYRPGAAGVLTVVRTVEPGRQGPRYTVQSIRTGERWQVVAEEIQAVSSF